MDSGASLCARCVAEEPRAENPELLVNGECYGDYFIYLYIIICFLCINSVFMCVRK